MSDFKRWTDAQSDATDAEREVLAAGSAKGLALGADRKAELRRALAIAISLPLPPDDGGDSGAGQGGGSPPPAAPPVTPPPIAEAAGALGSVGKLIFSGKASGALVAFALAAGSTAGVLGVATLTQDRPPVAPAVATGAPIVKQHDERATPPSSREVATDEAPSPAAIGSATVPDPATPPVARPARSLGERPAPEAETPGSPAPPIPTEAPPAPPVAVVPSLPTSGAVLVIPTAADARLADEIARVRAARDALRSGNASRTLSLLDALDREHPAGTLGQEREAMRIEALAISGRTSEARTRADAFLARHRGSAFATSVSRFATR